MSDVSIRLLALIVGISRLIFPIAYVVTVLFILAEIRSRTLPSIQIASRDFPRSHQIVAGDIETSTAVPLLGKHLARDVKKGETVDARMVSDESLSMLPTEARDLPRDHKIVTGDVEAISPSLKGRYLLKDIKKGATLYGDAVTDEVPSTLPVASRDLLRDHKIADSDVETPTLLSVRGKYLVKDVKKGDIIDTDAVIDRVSSALPRASRDLPNNHKIRPTDIETSETPSVIGKYTTRELKKGDIVDNSVVSDSVSGAKSTEHDHRRKRKSRHRA
jgi:hypothetical protein